MTSPAGVRPDTVAPIAVALRSDCAESLHCGVGVVVDPDGATVAQVGDPTASVYLRSSTKIFQTAALVGEGLALPASLLALVAASHSGEPEHLAGVVAILERHGLTVDDLRNTPTLPYGVDAQRAAIRAAAPPSSLFQNCSGKHAGMVATCRVNGWSVDDYLRPDHPVQVAIERFLRSVGVDAAHVGVDGCGAPAHVVGVRAAALGLRRLALDGSGVLDAMRAEPYMVGGPGRDVTAWMRAVPGLAVKDGAAGVMALVIADGPRRGTAAVYKIADGSDDARRAVTPAALVAMGVDVERCLAEAPAEVREALGPVAVRGGGVPVGTVDPLPWSRGASATLA